jgi:hypothetical protein
MLLLPPPLPLKYWQDQPQEKLQYEKLTDLQYAVKTTRANNDPMCLQSHRNLPITRDHSSLSRGNISTNISAKSAQF